MQGILIFYYLGGAGGKFIANCLTYSGQVSFIDYAVAQRNDPVEYNRRLLDTVPDSKFDRSWLTKENGCYQLFGEGVGYIKNQGTTPAGAKLNDLSKLNNQWVPIMAHFGHEVTNIQQYFKNVPQRFIIVDADPSFIDHAIRLKWEDPSHCLDLDRYDEFKHELKTLKPDYCFSGWNPLLPDAQDRIIKFARWLDIDLDLTAAQDYINKYLEFHR
jgi:hypothetical protein